MGLSVINRADWYYGANLNLTFRNGNLTDKSQLGLR